MRLRGVAIAAVSTSVPRKRTGGRLAAGKRHAVMGITGRATPLPQFGDPRRRPHVYYRRHRALPVRAGRLDVTGTRINVQASQLQQIRERLEVKIPFGSKLILVG